MGSLSGEELTLSDLGDLDHPDEIGRVELTPEYADILSYGDHRVRLKTPVGGFLWYMPDRPLEVQVIASAEPADDATPVASFPVPHGSMLVKVGASLLAAVENRYGEPTSITIYDLADPHQPLQVGRLVTEDVPYLPTWVQRGQVRPAIHAIGNALVLVHQRQHDVLDESVMGTVCYTSLTQDVPCAGQVGCTYAAGEQTCHDYGEGTLFCTGGFARCTDHGDGESTCEARAASELEGAVPNTRCEPASPSRSWRQLELFVVDLSDPAAPALVDSIPMPPEHEAMSVLAHGSDFYVSTRVPVVVPGNPRPYAAYYLTRVGLSDPAQPAVASAVNVPGDLLAVHEGRLLMRHPRWGQQFIETALAQIRIIDGYVSLQRYHRFDDRSVGNVVVDDTGLMAAQHSNVWRRPWYDPSGAFDDKLTLMRITRTLPPMHAGILGFDVLSENALERRPEPYLLAGQRLLLRLYGGLAVIDVSDPAAPVARAFFQAKGALSHFALDNRELLIAAGQYGVLQLDLDADNLLDATP